jgi:hypothetical protein
MTTSKGEHGEGNYKASRQYNEATKQFVESGRVEDAAREAEPKDEVQAAEMANAEAEGRRRAKEEDPALRRGDANPAGKPVTDRSADQTTTPKPGQEGR